MSDEELKQIEDVPKGGPLESYRLKASFDWKKMKLFIDPLDHILYKVYYDSVNFITWLLLFLLIKNAQHLKKNIWETLRRDPVWIRSDEDPSCLKQKEIAQKRSL